MRRSPGRPVTTGRWPGAIRDWPLWRLQPWLLGYVLAVITAGAAAIGVATEFTAWRARDVLLYGLLLAFGTESGEAGVIDLA